MGALMFSNKMEEFSSTSIIIYIYSGLAVKVIVSLKQPLWSELISVKFLIAYPK